MPDKEIIFWKDGWEGTADRGRFVRNSELKRQINKVQIELGLKVVGIVFNGTDKLELLTEEPPIKN